MRKYAFIMIALLFGLCFAGCSKAETEAVATPTESTQNIQEAETNEEDASKPEKKSKKKNKKKDDDEDSWESLSDDNDSKETFTEVIPPTGRDISNNMSSSEMDRIQNKLNKIGYYGFLLSSYTDPHDIYWDEVFYVGAGLDHDNGGPSAKIIDAYLKATGEDEIYTDITSVSGKDVREYVKKTTGFDYSEMKHPLDWVYLKDYDLYLNEHGDTNQIQVYVTAGHYENGEYAITYTGGRDDSSCVIFTEDGDTLKFKANVPEWMAKDPTNGGEIDQTAITEGMIIPDSDERKLTEADLEGLSAEELRIARNEIYARHGRKFADKKLMEHFNGMEWYFPTYEPNEFDEKIISDIERYNLDLITEYEKKLKK